VSLDPTHGRLVEELSEALPCSGQLALGMSQVGPTQCETQCWAVLASFDKQCETLIANNPDPMEEINLFRTGLIKIGQLIQTSPQQHGNGAAWK
jgi:enamine deaminase RidA (YjgF/YER057c/UK114 family)